MYADGEGAAGAKSFCANCTITAAEVTDDPADTVTDTVLDCDVENHVIGTAYVHVPNVPCDVTVWQMPFCPVTEVKETPIVTASGDTGCRPSLSSNWKKTFIVLESTYTVGVFKMVNTCAAGGGAVCKPKLERAGS